MRLTRQQRIEIFRPHVIIQRLDDQESRFVESAMRIVNWQAQYLASMYATNTSQTLILAPKLVRDLADSLASSMIDTFALGEVSIQNELIAAQNIRDSKAQFKNPGVVPQAGAPFYPENGVEWYREYTLRLVGVNQQDALEKAKQAIIDGVEQGKPQYYVMEDLQKEFTDFSKWRLENIARTETAKIYEQARWQELDADESIIGYEVAAIMDTRTSAICQERDGKRIPKDKIDGWLPPYHYMCRTVILPLFRWEDGIEFDDVSAVEPALPGFGTTSMEIPEYRDRKSAQVIRTARKSA